MKCRLKDCISDQIFTLLLIFFHLRILDDTFIKFCLSTAVLFLFHLCCFYSTRLLYQFNRPQLNSTAALLARYRCSRLCQGRICLSLKNNVTAKRVGVFVFFYLLKNCFGKRSQKGKKKSKIEKSESCVFLSQCLTCVFVCLCLTVSFFIRPPDVF